MSINCTSKYTMMVPGEFKKIDPRDLAVKPVELIGHEWMLITAGKKNDFNTMTAAWGGIGFLWNIPVVNIYVRPQRYTYEFTEKYDDFTLCFFDKQYRDILKYCGTKSGRDVDKAKETGLKAQKTDKGNIYFRQSKIVLECRKIYYDDIKAEKFLDDKLRNKIYPLEDYHRVYTGEIFNCMIKS